MLTKSAHFLPIKTFYSVAKYAQLYLDKVVKLHEVPLSIISDRRPQFTSRFWKAFQEALGTWLDLRIDFYLQTDSQSKRTIQILEDMLRACILDFEGNWENIFLW